MNLSEIKTRFDTDLIEIKPSKIKNAGYGAFAKKNIKSGIRLSEYKGQRIDIHNVHKLNINNNSDYRMIVGKAPNIIIIDSQEKYIDKSNWTRYVNSVLSMDDNKLNIYTYQYNKSIYYKSLRDIRKGEELLTYYGPDYWKNR